MIALLALLLAATPGPVCNAVWRDDARNRDVPVRVRMPAGTGKVPLVLFSHGMGGDTSGGTLWASAWAARGLAVIQMQHAGSDIAVYRDAPTPADVPARVRGAATAEQLLARVGDARFVLNEVARRPRGGACNLARINPDRIGFAGHSMGAWTAQALAGQRWGGGVTLADRRIRAAIALSPSAPFVGDPAEAFGKIGMPFLSITGTEDGAPALASAEVRAAAEAERTAPYRAMPPGDKYLLVFADADHMVFSGNARRAERTVDPHVKAVTAAATTAFWGATLLGSAKDKAFLAKGLKAQLAPGDRLETK
ncbi:alpha/beta hydrolase family protein [Sandarakinorhabdus sp. DWP1-3-1]|uniref:alpha/beta hydrolase family protein n=1 Tax=Sandarakinorhabdus sp. DWP1-3-1 TaxID=2804627 RepID=UPI003CE9D2B1